MLNCYSLTNANSFVATLRSNIVSPYLGVCNMRFILLVAVLLLNGCDNSSSTTKIAAPQRAALDQAKEVDQVVQNATEASRKKIEDAER
jgi:uncharacterized lipoprotein YajG